MEKEIIKRRLDKAFQYLDRVVPQPGLSVDNLADARRELRILFAEINRPDRETAEVENDG